MSWPDPWPQTDEEVRGLEITDPYDRFFKRRTDVVARLFHDDECSIDGIALAMVSLSALAEYRYRKEVFATKRSGKDQNRFRRLLEDHCPSFENRLSIPELLGALRSNGLHALEGRIASRYPVNGGFAAREPEEDPITTDFERWAESEQVSFPEQIPICDYAGCIFRDYRNSVVHELRIANGKDAPYFGDKAHQTTVYYMNCDESDRGETEDEWRKSFYRTDPVEYMRLGVKYPYLLQLLREAVVSLRQWSLDNDRHIFAEDE